MCLHIAKTRYNNNNYAMHVIAYVYALHVYNALVPLYTNLYTGAVLHTSSPVPVQGLLEYRSH